MARKKKKYNLKTRITSALRRIWLYSPYRREAVKRGKDNGNKCELCGDFQERLEIDHKIPVVDLKGWNGDWAAYIERLFCDSKDLLAICTNCHQSKTMIQRKQREKHKKKQRKIQKVQRKNNI